MATKKSLKIAYIYIFSATVIGVGGRGGASPPPLRYFFRAKFGQIKIFFGHGQIKIFFGQNIRHKRQYVELSLFIFFIAPT